MCVCVLCVFRGAKNGRKETVQDQYILVGATRSALTNHFYIGKTYTANYFLLSIYIRYQREVMYDVIVHCELEMPVNQSYLYIYRHCRVYQGTFNINSA